MSFHNVLILEDSLIIAMEAEDLLTAMGIEKIDIVNTIEQANDAMMNGHYDFALLDVNLGNGFSFDFARQLMARKFPFGFVSGYSNTMDFPPELQNVPLLMKPFDETRMREFIEKLS